MSDTPTVPQGTDPSASPVVPAPREERVAPPPKVDVPKVEMTPAQLKERLEEERVKGEKRASELLASELGVSLADAKRILAEAKAKEDANKSEVQRLVEKQVALEQRLSEFDTYKGAVESRAAYEFALLDDAQKAAVEKAAGNNPAKRLEIIDAFRPTWAAAKASAEAMAKAAEDAKAAAEAAAKANAAPPPKIPAPATTTPAAPPPPPTAPGQPTNHLAVYESLKQSNPAAAAKYHTAHAPAILAARRQQSPG